MKILVSVDTGNAAFTDYEGELQRVLSSGVDAVCNGRKRKNLYDTNGNKVGYISVVLDFAAEHAGQTRLPYKED